MTKKEIELLSNFLDDYENRLSSDGCNDFIFENTKENRAMMKRVYTLCEVDEEDFPLPNKKDKNIYTYNTLILCYLKKLVINRLSSNE